MPQRTTYKHQRESFYIKYWDILTIIFQKQKKDLLDGKIIYYIDNNDIIYEYATDIVNVYMNIDNIIEKEALLDVILLLISDTEDKIENWNFIWIIWLSFFALCKLWFFDEAMRLLKVSKNQFSIIKPIGDIIDTNNTYFDSNELGVIVDKLKEINSYFEKVWYNEYSNETEIIINKIIDLRYLNLKKQLNHFNQEINTDKKQVIEYLKKFWFEEKYDKTLNVLDKFLWNDTDESIIPWWAIWTLREFFKDFYIDLAKKISNINWLDETPKNEKSTEEIWHAVNYIWKEFNLSWDEKKLLWVYKDITNNIWSHSMLSEKKYLRLTRNIWIEICLFMLTKFEDYKLNIN